MADKKAGMMPWIIILILIILVVGAIGAYVAAYMYTLSKIDIVGVELEDVNNINLKGFTFSGKATVQNNGIMDVAIDRITYSIVLDMTGDEIASGIVEGGPIKAKETAEFSFTNDIKWDLSAKTVLDLLKAKERIIKVSGVVYIGGWFKTEVPFETEFDLTKYINLGSLDIGSVLGF